VTILATARTSIIAGLLMRANRLPFVRLIFAEGPLVADVLDVGNRGPCAESLPAIREGVPWIFLHKIRCILVKNMFYWYAQIGAMAL